MTKRGARFELHKIEIQKGEPRCLGFENFESGTFSK